MSSSQSSNTQQAAGQGSAQQANHQQHQLPPTPRGSPPATPPFTPQLQAINFTLPPPLQTSNNNGEGSSNVAPAIHEDEKDKENLPPYDHQFAEQSASSSNEHQGNELVEDVLPSYEAAQVIACGNSADDELSSDDSDGGCSIFDEDEGYQQMARLVRMEKRTVATVDGGRAGGAGVPHVEPDRDMSSKHQFEDDDQNKDSREQQETENSSENGKKDKQKMETPVFPPRTSSLPGAPSSTRSTESPLSNKSNSDLSKSRYFTREEQLAALDSPEASLTRMLAPAAKIQADLDIADNDDNGDNADNTELKKQSTTTDNHDSTPDNATNKHSKYVSPSDAIVSPCTQKLAALKMKKLDRVKSAYAAGPASTSNSASGTGPRVGLFTNASTTTATGGIGETRDVETTGAESPGMIRRMLGLGRGLLGKKKGAEDEEKGKRKEKED